MLAERTEIAKAEEIATGLGYELQHGVDDYALREWYLGFANHSGLIASRWRSFSW